MSRITITIDTSTVSITQKFEYKEYKSHRAVLKAALDWLKSGTPFEEKDPKPKEETDNE